MIIQNPSDIIQLVVELIFVKMIVETVSFFHKKLFKSMIKSSIEFFEMTPFESLINRFDRDVSILENEIPAHIKTILYHLFKIFSISFIIAVISPYFLIAAIPISALFILCEVIMRFVWLNNGSFEKVERIFVF